jgi:hypothetical protein
MVGSQILARRLAGGKWKVVGEHEQVEASLWWA